LKTGYIRLSGFNLVSSARRGKYILVGVVMGGRSAHLRDQRMVDLLDRGFAALESGASATADVADVPEATSSPQISYQPPAAKQPFANDNGFVSPSASKSQGYHAKWAVQVGAFSNPKDAMMAATHAVQMASAYLQNSKIEIVSDASTQNIHRARLTQLSENQARSACSALIRQRESCFVLNLDS
jgi:D-alanyl-D-alanine carboxypeptidase